MKNEKGLGVFKGKPMPDVETVWDFYGRGVRYDEQLDIPETVRCNENFYIGKQWENVQANGLPTPTFNFIKRVVMFDVSNITSNNIKVTATALAHTPGTDELIQTVTVVNEEFDALAEQNNLANLVREFARNAAVDGDGCMYTYFDDSYETGQKAKGAIRTEVLDNTDVFFGNPNSKDVEAQPYIIIRSQIPTREARLKAKRNGSSDFMAIQPDMEFANVEDSAKLCGDMTTVLLTLWRNDDTGTIWGYESTQNVEISEPWDLKIKRYPLVWLPWDYVKNSYHGQAMVTGILNNQIFVNRAWAMSMLSMMKTAYPKYVIDGSRINSIDNRVGGFIKVNGGDVGTAIKSIDPATISPQVAQYIDLAITQTEQCLGATSVALGDTRPDNTSAIIALQRAATTPIELTKMNLYQAIEDLFRIYLEFMSVHYGKRMVDTQIPDKVANAYAFIGAEAPDSIVAEFDFSTLKDHPMSLKLDVGASTYYSEIQSLTTLNNLYQNKAISRLQLLERLPTETVPNLRGLIMEIKSEEAQQQMMMQQQMGGGMPGEEAVPQDVDNMDVHGGGGYSALQRKINETGDTGDGIA